MSLLRRRLIMQNVGSTPLHPELEYYSEGDLLLTVRYNWTRRFIKYHDGFCISAPYRNNSGNPTNIIVIGLTFDSVLYGVLDSASEQPWGDVSDFVKTIVYGKTNYYVAIGAYAMPGVPQPDFFNEKTYSSSESAQLLPAYDLLDYYYGVI